MTPPQSPISDKELEDRIQLLSMTPVPGFVVVRKQTYFGLLNDETKRNSEQIKLNSKFEINNYSARKSQPVHLDGQEFFTVRDEYSQSNRFELDQTFAPTNFQFNHNFTVHDVIQELSDDSDDVFKQIVDDPFITNTQQNSNLVSSTLSQCILLTL